MADVTVSADALRSFLTSVFAKTGMPQADAEFSAWATVQCDLWGIDSHGTLRTPDYEKRLRNNIVNPTPKIVNKLHPDLPIAHLDGDKGLGYIVSRDGMQLAIEKAKKSGIAFVLTTNSNHNGAEGLYVRMAAKANMLGLAVTNVRPNIGMPGVTKPVTGNNPVALAAPMPDGEPFCIDVAMSMVAQGKLIYAKKKGVPIPEGWATDTNGVATTDPAEGIKGILLPVGMHKGFGISLFIDILTSVMGGGPFLTQIESMYTRPDEANQLAHAFIVINPDMFMDRAEFLQRMGEWRALIKATPVQPGRPDVIIPGEPEIATEKQRLANGIVLPAQLWADLQAIAQIHGLAMPTAG